MKQQRVIVIGGGLAGLSGAIRLARMGFDVQLFEKNACTGGKMNTLSLSGAHGTYHFGTGPSLLTMPSVIDELFAFAEVERSSVLEFIALEPICRYFYPDGTQLNAYANMHRMTEEISRSISPLEAHNYEQFLRYAQRIYTLTSEIFLHTPFQELRTILRWRYVPILLRLAQIDPLRSVHDAVSTYFRDSRLIQLFDRYPTYNGSSPFHAPATLNIIPWVEYGLGGFYIRGGMYKLAEEMTKLARRLGVCITTQAPVEKIIHNGQRVRGVQVLGERIESTYVLCNADVVEAHSTLIDGFSSYRKRLQALEPSLSGMVLYWGMNRSFPELAHHNILFSRNYQHEFHQIFHQKVAPDEPTVYISISSKTDAPHAPQGGENWFVLLNMPYLNGQNWDNEALRMKSAVLQRLRQAGLDVESAIDCEHVHTPQDMYTLYRSNKGSIYGISSNTVTAAFLRPANRSRQLEGLYFCGGSSHPGGGVPLVLLSGKMAAELIAHHASRPVSA
ncbi:MAG: phytoene desaturase family protein [Bacteroidota bacterium]|nr:phytoene desaturase family protein [Candidatus Kapabacteria bacterium]MDW8220112.1 phytoene desaturase family protein [Bacteroidota bacterium]